MAKKYDYEKILSDFNSEFGYVTIDTNIVKRFSCANSNAQTFIFFMTWCMSQNIHHGVQE